MRGFCDLLAEKPFSILMLSGWNSVSFGSLMCSMYIHILSLICPSGSCKDTILPPLPLGLGRTSPSLVFPAVTLRMEPSSLTSCQPGQDSVPSCTPCLSICVHFQAPVMSLSRWRQHGSLKHRCPTT